MVRNGHAPLLLTVGLASLVVWGPARAGVGGYTLNRVIVWAEAGDPNPRFQQDPETHEFAILFPAPPNPSSPWQPVKARRFISHNGGFVQADPVSLFRPNDPDPDWAAAATEAALDLNRDGRAETARTRNVVIPDDRDPFAGTRRVLVEIQEESRILFADLLEGYRDGPVHVHSLAAVDFTGEGYPDLVVRLESDGRTGLAFYSQTRLMFPGVLSRTIPGFSTIAFRCDRYGIFDLRRSPGEFFSHLPPNALPENPSCPTDAPAVELGGHSRCVYRFSMPYLGWIQRFQVDFIPDGRLLSFELFFPVSGPSLTPEQVLGFLTPVLGAGFIEEMRGEGDARRRVWIWKETKARAKLLWSESEKLNRAVSLRLESD